MGSRVLVTPFVQVRVHTVEAWRRVAVHLVPPVADHEALVEERPHRAQEAALSPVRLADVEDLERAGREAF